MQTILFPIADLPVGGTQQQLLELVRGLDKASFHPIVATLAGGGALEREFRAVPGAEVVVLERRGKWDVSAVWNLTALIRARHVDIVQPFLPPTTSFGLMAALLARTPGKIMTERSGARRVLTKKGESTSDGRRSGASGFFYLRLQDLLTRFANCVVANSEAGRESLIARGVPAHKILVVPNGINFDALEIDGEVSASYRARFPAPTTTIIGIIASLLPVKRHDIFLRAAKLISERLPGTGFAIFGDGPLRADLQQLVANLGLGAHVVFFGACRPAANCLGACDLLVSTSQVEGLSNSILEAMALEVPVVATNIPGNREIVVDRSSGYLVPVDDEHSLAATVEHALTHAAETQTYVQHARAQVVAQFGLARMIATHEALYRSLAPARLRPAVAASN